MGEILKNNVRNCQEMLDEFKEILKQFEETKITGVTFPQISKMLQKF